MNSKKYTIKIQQGVQVLMADGAPQICPFQSATPAQDKFRGISLIPAACTAQCPHFNIVPAHTENKISIPDIIELTCGPAPSNPRILQKSDEDPKPESKSGIILN